MSLREKIEAIRITDPHDSTVGEVLGVDKMDELMNIIKTEILAGVVEDHSMCVLSPTCTGYMSAVEDIMYAIGAKK